MAESVISEMLPKKFVSRQQLLLYYNDLIVDILKKADELNLSTTTFSWEKEEVHPEENDDLIDWLLENGFEEKAYSALKPHIFFSLLKDFILYMHESFDCIERGKVTVAYTLCRKSLKDTLFYICWLLSDEKDIISRLLKDNPKQYDTSALNETFKKKILKEACEKSENIFDAELIYNIIYDRKCRYGLAGIWDQSIHLVTTNKNYATAKGNLNFVFSDEENWHEYWEKYYDAIPLVMKFAVEVIISIFESIMKSDETIVILNNYLRNMKFVQSTGSGDQTINNLVKELLQELRFICDNCSSEYPLVDTVADEIINDYLYTCPNCHQLERVGQYFYSESE